MSVEAMSWAFAQTLPPCPKSVLVALANRADEDGQCWPGLDDLEQRTGWNRRSIQRAIKDLQERGLLVASFRFKPMGGQNSNLYRLACSPTFIPSPRPQGDRVTPGGVTQGQGEGDTQSPRGVTPCHGEGDTVSPESSSESSVEQSLEHDVGLTPDAARLWALAEALIGFLNRKAKKNYQARKPNKDPTVNLKAVHALLKQGYTEEQVRKVIGNRVLKWGDDPKMREYLRPDTLFRPSKFEQYLGELGVTHAMPHL